MIKVTRRGQEPGLGSAALSCLLSGRLRPAKPPEEDVKHLLREAEQVLAGLGVRAACWAPATPPGPRDLMCLWAGSGPPVRPLLLSASAILRAQPAAHQRPRRVRKQPLASGSSWHLRVWASGLWMLTKGGYVGSAEVHTDRTRILPVISWASPCFPGPQFFHLSDVWVGLIPWHTMSGLQQNEKNGDKVVSFPYNMQSCRPRGKGLAPSQSADFSCR